MGLKRWWCRIKGESGPDDGGATTLPRAELPQAKANYGDPQKVIDEAPAPAPAPAPAEPSGIPLLFPLGHFYSPVADPVDIRRREGRIWARQDAMSGIDLHEDRQLALLRQLKGLVDDLDWPVDKPEDPTQYFYGNDQYPVLDAEFLWAALRHFRPRRFIEVGSGFSSLITAQANRRHFGGALEFSCIEPYPRQFLIDGVEGVSRLVRERVEDVDPAFFDHLDQGDILFIDSSHVSKVGSDVNHLFFEVLPRLRPGVLVHIHDIFLPDEYPKAWVIDQGRHWNEQYLVRAFLQFNRAWEVVWAAHFMGTRHTAAVQDVFGRFPRLGGGGSLWLQRTTDAQPH